MLHFSVKLYINFALKLKQGWHKLFELEGYQKMTSDQIVSILSDFGVFREMPHLKLCVKMALEYGALELINTCKLSDLRLHRLKLKLQNDGFSENVLKDFYDSFILNDNLSTNDKFNFELLQFKNKTKDGIICLNDNQKWCYVTNNNEMITPFYYGLSVINSFGFYAGASSLRKYRRDKDGDAHPYNYMNLNDNELLCSIYIGCNQIRSRELELRDGKYYHIDQWIPDKWRLYDVNHIPVSKEYRDIFLCETDINIKSENKRYKYYSYNYVQFNKSGFILVKREYHHHNLGVINFKGEEIISPEYDDIQMFKGGFLAYYAGHLNLGMISWPTYVVYDYLGNKLFSLSNEYDKFDKIKPDRGKGFFIIKDKKTGYINNNFKFIIPSIYDTVVRLKRNENFIKVSMNNDEGVRQVGIFDDDGNLILDCKYESIKRFNDYFYVGCIDNYTILFTREFKEIIKIHAHLRKGSLVVKSTEKKLSIFTPFEFECDDGRNLVILFKDYDIYYELHEGSFISQDENCYYIKLNNKINCISL